MVTFQRGESFWIFNFHLLSLPRLTCLPTSVDEAASWFSVSRPLYSYSSPTLQRKHLCQPLSLPEVRHPWKQGVTGDTKGKWQYLCGPRGLTIPGSPVLTIRSFPMHCVCFLFQLKNMPEFCFQLFLISFLAMPRSMWDLSSLTRK